MRIFSQERPQTSYDSVVAIPSRRERRKNGRTLRGGVVAGVAFAAVTSGLLGMTALPASAANAQQTGVWYHVCADSLSEYNSGQIATLTWNNWFYVDHFAGSNHVWGYGYPNGGGAYYGWVYNGWFC